MGTSEPPPLLLTPIDNIAARDYVPYLLFFPRPANLEVSTVVTSFRDGLFKTIQAIGPLSGTVQLTGQRGGLCVTRPWRTVDEIFRVKDLRHTGGLEYSQLRDQNFPIGTLNKELLPWADLIKTEKMVMLIQLNIIHGGFIMCLSLHHSFADATGFAVVVKLWAASCRGQDCSQLVTRGMIERERLMQGWGDTTFDGFPGMELSPTEKLAPSPKYYNRIYNFFWRLWTDFSRRWIATTDNGTPKIDNTLFLESKSAVFFFSKSKLAELKSIASPSDHLQGSEAWISNNDAICAFIACSLSSTSLWMVVGGRRVLDPPLPPDYIGNIASFIEVKIGTADTEPTLANVAKVASQIRYGVRQRDERYLRKLIAALSSLKDIARVVCTPILPSENILFTSFAHLDFYDEYWGDGIGARVERLRLGFGCDNFCVILPELRSSAFSDEDCGLEISIGLEEEKMAQLKQSEFFLRFAQPV